MLGVTRDEGWVARWEGGGMGHGLEGMGNCLTDAMANAVGTLGTLYRRLMQT